MSKNIPESRLPFHDKDKDCWCIRLTQGHVAYFDEIDLPKIRGFRWTWLKDGYTEHGYAKILLDGKTILMHRLISGVAPGEFIDHENRNGCDNRRSNILGPQRNRKIPMFSRFKGVTKAGNRFKTRVRLHGIEIHIGHFDTEIEAARAYDAAAIKHFGEFACTNEKLDLYESSHG